MPKKKAIIKAMLNAVNIKLDFLINCQTKMVQSGKSALTGKAEMKMVTGVEQFNHYVQSLKAQTEKDKPKKA